MSEMQPERIDDIREESPEEMLARLAGRHGVSDASGSVGEGLASVRALTPSTPSTPAAVEPETPAPSKSSAPEKTPKASRSSRSTTARTPKPAADTQPAPARTRAAVNIPASIYATTKAHAEATHVSLTEYALTAINTHAKALPAVFAARPEPVAGPIPLASGPRQRRDVGEPLVALQMYLTPQQASALDDLVASTRAGSRSALVTEALRATI